MDQHWIIITLEQACQDLNAFNTLSYWLLRAMHNRNTRQKRTSHIHVHPTAEKCTCDFADSSRLAREQQARMNEDRSSNVRCGGKTRVLRK